MTKPPWKLATVALLLASSFGTSHPVQGASTPGQLRQGRYIGHIKLDDRNEKIALVADFFLESPEDLTKFPRLNAILKLSLGGYNTTEYMTEVYKDIRYDFEGGVLTLDEPNSDLVVSAEVQSRGSRTYLQGPVWIRSSAKSATLELLLETDEPDDDVPAPGGPPGHGDHDRHGFVPPGDTENLPFAPLLDGQYVGLCDNEASVFQIQTMKGRKKELGEGEEIFDYEIVARLGRRAPEKERPPHPWTTYADYAAGAYNPYTGRLVFMGPSTTPIDCSLNQDRLLCRYRIPSKRVSCEFKKQSAEVKRPAFYKRQFGVSPTPDQRRPLPEAAPPKNSALASAVSGSFQGYLHHEASNLYQIVRLRVTASSSTENPHNPNKLAISTTASLHFGREASEEFLPQRYEPRSFYIRPGFTLNAPGTDSFITIEDWTTGYIRGVWYSHAFGRVGTVQLVKGALPPLPPAAQVVQGWTGEFEGDGKRWFQLLLPPQASERTESTVSLAGSFQAIVGVTAVRPIDRGRYDPYTGALGWVFTANDGYTMVSGNVDPSGGLLLHWPPPPHLFSAYMADYLRVFFKKVDGT